MTAVPPRAAETAASFDALRAVRGWLRAAALADVLSSLFPRIGHCGTAGDGRRDSRGPGCRPARRRQPPGSRRAAPAHRQICAAAGGQWDCFLSGAGWAGSVCELDRFGLASELLAVVQ